MYEELTDRLRRYSEACVAYKLDADFASAVQEAAETIEEMQRCIEQYKLYLQDAINDLHSAHEKEPKWIPVTERLPKAERKSYWICTDTGYQCECRWTNDRFGIIESDEWGWKIFDIPQYQKVVAWMPLPKPYEPPKEES